MQVVVLWASREVVHCMAHLAGLKQAGSLDRPHLVWVMESARYWETNLAFLALFRYVGCVCPESRTGVFDVIAHWVVAD